MSIIDELKKIGLEVPDALSDSVSAIDSKFVPYSDYEATQSELDGLKSRLQTAEEGYESLKASVGENDTLKAKIDELQALNASEKERFENELFNVRKNHALENALSEAKVINHKTVIPLLEDVLAGAKLDEGGKIVGLAEALNALKASEDTGFLFRTEEAPVIHGAMPAGSAQNTPGGSADYEVRLSEARKSGNTSLAIAIKREAANNGIILM